MSEINWIAIAVAALTSFMLGGFWYSPLGFLKIWAREEGIDISAKREGHPAIVFGLSYVLGFIAAAVLARYLGPHPTMEHAVLESFLVGTGFVATTFGINYLFTDTSRKLWLINAGYHVIQITIFGVVLALFG